MVNRLHLLNLDSVIVNVILCSIAEGAIGKISSCLAIFEPAVNMCSIKVFYHTYVAIYGYHIWQLNVTKPTRMGVNVCVDVFWVSKHFFISIWCALLIQS